MLDVQNTGCTACHPVERYAAAEVGRQSHLFAPDGTFGVMLDAVPNPLVVLNDQRQVVFANRALLALAGEESPDRLFGLRPGEVVDCKSAAAGPSGCGSAEGCRWCEMVNIIMAALNGEERVADCHLLRVVDGKEEHVDLRGWTRPLMVDGERFVILSLADIGNEKRRQALEHTFFHDLMNSLGSIKGLLDLARYTEDPAEREELFALMRIATSQAVEEIASQRMLVLAENRELHVEMEPFDSHSWLDELVEIFRKHHLTASKVLELIEMPEDRIIVADRTLLHRILVNMLKNALEATPPGGRVKIGCRRERDDHLFWVHNATPIPAEHQPRIFNRSFSTRGTGRGIGTYSMRLLSSYLGGKVDFVSNPDDGTTFFLTCPCEQERP